MFVDNLSQTMVLRTFIIKINRELDLFQDGLILSLIQILEIEASIPMPYGQDLLA